MYPKSPNLNNSSLYFISLPSRDVFHISGIRVQELLQSRNDLRAAKGPVSTLILTLAALHLSQVPREARRVAPRFLWAKETGRGNENENGNEGDKGNENENGNEEEGKNGEMRERMGEWEKSYACLLLLLCLLL